MYRRSCGRQCGSKNPWFYQTTVRAGKTVPATSPKPMRGQPSRRALPRMMMVSPS